MSDAVVLSLFDLDHTLLDGDSDYLWGCFLAEQGLVDADSYQAKNRSFYDDYLNGVLDIDAFLRFQLAPLAEHDMTSLHRLRDRYIDEKIRPIILPRALETVKRHQALGPVAIITATNRFVTAPIAQLFAVPELLATEPEQHNGRYTGAVVGTPCFQHGKLEHLDRWLAKQPWQPDTIWFYSDSRNDIPLLERATHPVATNPDDALRAHAQQEAWAIEDWT